MLLVFHFHCYQPTPRAALKPEKGYFNDQDSVLENTMYSISFLSQSPMFQGDRGAVKTGIMQKQLFDFCCFLF